MDKLTPKQSLVYEYLKSNIKENGYPPSVREICQGLNLRSPATVHAHLTSLEEKGYIQKSKSKNRAIEILETDFYSQPSSLSAEYLNVPILGTVAAGAPILAVENIEGTFPIPIEYGKNKNLFMLKVKGDSMINKGIYEDDLVLVRQQPTANERDIVVALIDDSATVKTFFRDKNGIRLQPENDAYEPIITKDAIILGKVIGLFRDFI